MKKLIICLLACLSIGSFASAQVMQGYGVGVEKGTYTPLVSPTIISNGKALLPAGFTDAASNTAIFKDTLITKTFEVEGIPIGFDFKFGDLVATGFGVSPAGYIILTGDDAVTFNPTRPGYLFTTETDVDNVAGIAFKQAKIDENTKIGYKLKGEVGSRELAIELSNIQVSTGSWNFSDSIPMSFQYVLSEADNSIKLITKGLTDFGESYGTCYVGIKQAYGDYMCVTTNSTWDEAYGVSSSSSIQFGNTKCGAIDGTTIVFTYPSPCATPKAQPTDLKTTFGTDFVKGSFVAPEESADNYLVIVSKGKEVSFLPQNGVKYAENDSVCEGGFVVYYGNDADEDSISFETYDLEPSTEYILSVFSANSIGSNGPAYLITEPLTSTFTTMPAAPASLQILGTTTTTLNFSASANENGDKVMVVATSDVRETGLGWNTAPYFGQPAGKYEVGDTIAGTEAVVVWIGESTDDTQIENLASGTGWYLCAYSISPDGLGYSSAVLEAGTSTVGSMPYVPNFNQTIYPELPTGWTNISEDNILQCAEENVDENRRKMLRSSYIRGSEDEPANIGFVTIPVEVDQRYGSFSLDWALSISSGSMWLAKYSPMTFVKGDSIQMSVSEDGENWTAIKTINSANGPKYEPDSLGNLPAVVWNHMDGDLSEYVGKKIWLKFALATVQSGSRGLSFYIDSISVAGQPIPVVPEVRVDEIGTEYATIAWRGEQTSYEVQWGLADATDEELTSEKVEIKTITLENLEGATQYKVRVRGLAENEDDWSAWSEFLEFTTKDWPEVQAPSGLTTTLNDEDPTTAVLTWDSNDDYLYYTLRYRKGTETAWFTVDSIAETTYTLTNLEQGMIYLWSVKAVCTHDRVTSWANQEQFTTKELDALRGIVNNGLNVRLNSGRINVASANSDIIEVRIVDLTGRLVNANVSSGASNVSVEAPKGIFLVQVIKTNGTSTFRMINK